MDGNISPIQERLREESAKASYPYEKHSISDRYKDTSLSIHKEFRSVHKGSFLSFGSRRASLVSSYGNTPTFMRRSFSSSGALEFAVEQYSSIRRPVNKVLPSIKKSVPSSITESLNESSTPYEEDTFPVHLTNNVPKMKPRSKNERNLAYSKKIHHYDAKVNHNSRYNKQAEVDGLLNTRNSSAEMSRDFNSTSMENVYKRVASISLDPNSVANPKENEKGKLMGIPANALMNIEKSEKVQMTNPSVLPAIYNSSKDLNRNSNNNHESSLTNMPPMEKISGRRELSSKPKSSPGRHTPTNSRNPSALTLQRYSNESNHQQIDLPSLTTKKGPGENTRAKSSPLPTTYLTEFKNTSINYTSKLPSEIISFDERNKRIEKTVGENLQTTTGRIKSIPYSIDASPETLNLDQDGVYTNSSKLCVVM